MVGSSWKAAAMVSVRTGTSAAVVSRVGVVVVVVMPSWREAGPHIV
jgi:hypothetical protein